LISFKLNDITYSKKLLSEQAEYLKLDKSEQKVMGWMTIRYVQTNYELQDKKNLNGSKNKAELQSLLGVSKLKLRDYKKTLNTYCFENDLDCNDLISNLNEVLVKK